VVLIQTSAFPFTVLFRVQALAWLLEFHICKLKLEL